MTTPYKPGLSKLFLLVCTFLVLISCKKDDPVDNGVYRHYTITNHYQTPFSVNRNSEAINPMYDVDSSSVVSAHTGDVLYFNVHPLMNGDTLSEDIHISVYIGDTTVSPVGICWKDSGTVSPDTTFDINVP